MSLVLLDNPSLNIISEDNVDLWLRVVVEHVVLDDNEVWLMVVKVATEIQVMIINRLPFRFIFWISVDPEKFVLQESGVIHFLQAQEFLCP